MRRDIASSDPRVYRFTERGPDSTAKLYLLYGGAFL